MARKARGIEVQGTRELVRALKAASPELVKELKAVNKDMATRVADTARPLVPVRTGRLMKSVRPGATQKSGVVRAGGARVPYAGPIHFGWPERKPPAQGGPIRPNPFLYDALDARRSEVEEAYIVAVQKIVTKVNNTRTGA